MISVRKISLCSYSIVIKLTFNVKYLENIWEIRQWCQTVNGRRKTTRERFSDIFKMATVRHLGLVMSTFGQPTKRIWWSLSLLKISLESYWSRCSSFDDMQVLIFITSLAFRMPIHAPKMVFWGNYIP